jgi:hypothetical protein
VPKASRAWAHSFAEKISVRPSEADTWRAIRAPRLLAPRNFEAEELTPPSRESRNGESAFEERYRVTARGHLGGDRKNCAKGRSTGFGYRRDHCVLQMPVQLDLDTVSRSE